MLGAGQTASSEDAQLALTISKRMFNRWAIERLTILALLRTTKVLTSGTRDYTIGTSGSINIVRPNRIDHATIILDNTATDPLEQEIRVYTDAEWTVLGLKTLDAASIEGIFFDHAFNTSTQLGTISTFPTINISTATLVLYTPQATVGYSALTDDLVFAPGYEEAAHYGLARRLCGPFGRPVGDLQFQAEDALSVVKLANVQMADLVVPTPWLSGQYDINTDTDR